MSKNMGKAKVLSDDVLILRKQLESERNISKMYVDELQKIKMELNAKRSEIHYSEETLSTQKKKMHKFYQKMVGLNVNEMREQYEAHMNEMKEECEERVIEMESKWLLKLKANENALNEQTQACEEYKTKCEGLQLQMEQIQAENERLSERIISTQNENKKQCAEQSESMQRLLREQAAQKDAMLNKLETQKDAMQQCNAKEFEWKQKCEQMALKYKTMRQQNEGLKLKLTQTKSSKQRMEKYNLRYQQKLSVVRKL